MPLLVGFSGAFRRSELVAIDVADIEFTEEGVAVTIRRSKTDQEGEGRKVGLPRGFNGAETCAARALEAWLDRAGITFRWRWDSGTISTQLDVIWGMSENTCGPSWRRCY